jgi:tetratricopeptide (TPR) repeat protein
MLKRAGARTPEGRRLRRFKPPSPQGIRKLLLAIRIVVFPFPSDNRGFGPRQACLSDEQRQNSAVLLMVKFLSWPNWIRRPRLHLAQGGLVCFALLLLMAQTATALPKFESSLDRDTIALGESVTLSLTCEGGAPAQQPSLPSMPGIQFAGSSFSQQSFFDGTSSTTKTTYSYVLMPLKEGEFTIPALKVEIEGTRLTCQPLKLKVIKGSVPRPDGTPEPVFVKINAPKKEIYLGEVLPIEIQCYCQNATDIQLPQLAADGFLAGSMPDHRQQAPRVTISNAVYNLLSFKLPVTATKTGTLPLGPATWRLTALSGGRNIFGQWEGSHPVEVASDTPEIKVLPVPTANAPADFSGGVGRFSLQVYTAGPTNVAVGDPITLKIRINGRGSIETLALPASQPEWREFKTYPATGKFETTDPMRVEGSKVFEQVITPQNAGVKEIPAFALSYFDPDQKQFHTLSHQPIPITVHPTVATPQPTIISTGAPAADSPPPTQEIVHIQSQLGTVRVSSAPLIRQPGFLALQAIAPLVWICSLVWRRQKERLANNPRLRRERAVARVVQRGMKELAAQAQENKTDEFYATVFRLMQEQLGERIDLPASAITEAALEDLHPKGLTAETLALLHELFHTCNQYRYAPQRTGQELASLIPKVQTAIQSLQQMPPTKASVSKASLQTVGCLLLLLGGSSLQAQDVGAAFNQANKLYEQAAYPQAAAAYEKLIEGGSVSTALYFNLGNAYFKAGQTGRAILSYRKAQNLTPRDPNVRANLQFARNQISNGNPALPGNRWTRWLGMLALNTWTVLAAGTVALFFLLLAARQIWPQLKKTSSGWTGALGLAGVLLVVCLMVAIDAQLNTRASVVIVPEAVARRGPFQESQSAFTVRDGTELLVLDQKNDWLQVGDGRKRVGWLPQKEVALISVAP